FGLVSFTPSGSYKMLRFDPAASSGTLSCMQGALSDVQIKPVTRPVPAGIKNRYGSAQQMDQEFLFVFVMHDRAESPKGGPEYTVKVLPR
ncbi:MAG: hypothetical protein JWM53_154, partial [bacterium]|nr:hypothetical protein [bacterium]